MNPLRNGDLIPVDDAAELIDSAQAAATTLAKCCAERDAEIARLREQLVMAGSSETYLNGEIKRLREAIVEDCLGHEAIDPRLECECALCQIAREGR